jgi:hypothetical protein
VEALPPAFLAARAASKAAEARFLAAQAEYVEAYAACSAIDLTDAQAHTLADLVAAEDHAATHAGCGCDLA